MSETHNVKRQRLDQLLAELGHFDSRARARDAILRGTVSVDGGVCSKPGAKTPANAEIAIDDPAQGYVSRAAMKLVAGLDHFGFEPTERTILDIGASTGGFTQALLERGASHVIAVDVGHGQLHESLLADDRVTNREGLNARDLPSNIAGGQTIGAVVSDVSFISLRLALPKALDMVAPGGFCLLLVKPQFEAGKAAIGKGGILRDPEAGPKIASELSEWLDGQPGWKSLGFAPSPIEGSDGNREFLLGGAKS